MSSNVVVKRTEEQERFLKAVGRKTPLTMKNLTKFEKEWSEPPVKGPGKLIEHLSMYQLNGVKHLRSDIRDEVNRRTIARPTAVLQLTQSISSPAATTIQGQYETAKQTFQRFSEYKKGCAMGNMLLQREISGNGGDGRMLKSLEWNEQKQQDALKKYQEVNKGKAAGGTPSFTSFGLSVAITGHGCQFSQLTRVAVVNQPHFQGFSDSSVLSMQGTLTHFELSGCTEISVLPLQALSGCSTLSVLKVDNNRLHDASVPLTLLRGTPFTQSLQQLDLSGNKSITEFPDISIFKHLTEFNADGCAILHIQEGRAKNVERIILSNNALNMESGCNNDLLTEPQYLNVSGNNITFQKDAQLVSWIRERRNKGNLTDSSSPPPPSNLKTLIISTQFTTFSEESDGAIRQYLPSLKDLVFNTK